MNGQHDDSRGNYHQIDISSQSQLPQSNSASNHQEPDQKPLMHSPETDHQQLQNDVEHQVTQQNQTCHLELPKSSSPSLYDSPEQNENHINYSSVQQRTKIFVGRLPEGCSSKDLEDLFGKYGTVSECDVVGKFGFVHMSKTEEAEECVTKLNKYSFMGSQLVVEFSTSKVHPEPGTFGRAKGDLRVIKGNRFRLNSPYHRESFNSNHKPPGRRYAPPPPPLPPPGRDYGAYSDPYYSDGYRSYERNSYYDTDYYARERSRPYPVLHDRRMVSYDYDDYNRRRYSPPPILRSPIPPPHPHSDYHGRRGPPSRAYDRDSSDNSASSYSSRSPSLVSHSAPHPQHPSSLPPINRSQYWSYPPPPPPPLQRDDYRRPYEAIR